MLIHLKQQTCEVYHHFYFLSIFFHNSPLIPLSNIREGMIHLDNPVGSPSIAGQESGLVGEFLKGLAKKLC